MSDYQSLYERCLKCLSASRQNPWSCPECFALIKLALDSDDQEATTYLYQMLEPWLKRQVSKACFRYGSTPDMVDFFVGRAFYRFWRSLRYRSNHLRDYEHGLRYFTNCVKSVVLDNGKPSSRIVDPTTPIETFPAEPDPEIKGDFKELWAILMGLLTIEKERLLATCYILWDMKPQEIVATYPQYWSTTIKVKADWQRIRRHLRCHPDIRTWFGIEGDCDS